MFKESIFCSKGSLLNVCSLNRDLVVRRSDVHGTEKMSARQSIDAFFCSRKWIRIFHGNLIQRSAIHAAAYRPIFLADEGDWSSPR